jgi:hypothetical protein
MHVRVSTFAPAVFVLLSLAASACEDNDAVLRAGMNTPSPIRAHLITVEPVAIVPEFLPSPFCRSLPPFRTRFNLIVRAERDLFLRRFGFAFRDRLGGRALPTAIPTSFAGAGMPVSPPVPMPSASAIPVPGTLPFHGVMLSRDVNTVGLLLNFDCGVPPEGTLFIDVETADRDGVQDVSHVSVRIGG